MASVSFSLPSGRHLGVTGFGDSFSRSLVVFCHPAPGSSRFDPDPTVSNSYGVRMLAIDRPGYGSSDPLPADEWPTITRAADDIAAYLTSAEVLADSMGAVAFQRRVSVVGWSAGGRVALALAARHPGVVSRVAICGTPAPQHQVPWIPEEFLSSTRQLLALPAAQAKERLAGMLARQLPGNEDGSGALALLGESESDESALAAPGARDRVDGMLRDAFRQGPAGFAADILSYATDDWGFDLSRVRAEVLLLYGADDPVVSAAHGRWYQSQLPSAEVEVVAGAGHFALLPSWRRILHHVEPSPESPH